jgi:hypothetical protein
VEQSAKVIDEPPMKTLIALSFIVIFGWLAVVTFCGPELARAINGPEPVKAPKVLRSVR